MLYREAGKFKTSYAADQALLRLDADRWMVLAVLAIAVVVIPATAGAYWLNSIFVPVLILAVAALGLNILVGYCGQISLGTGAFMAAGAYLSYKFATSFPDLPIVLSVFVGGLASAAIGLVFGLPSLRIKGFYLAVTTLAAQFFLLWWFTREPWFVNYSISGVPTAPERSMLGFGVIGASADDRAKYLFVLGFAILMTWIALNLVKNRIGRSWMAIRDMDVAAQLIGIRPLPTKLTAFAISSFYCGVAGALWSFCFINTVEPTAFDINRSFQVLFMVIIGGLGSVLGAYFGAFFIFLLPIMLNSVPGWFGIAMPGDLIFNLELMIFGALIIVFLIKEPLGLARLWALAREKLRLWPFPY